jgi:hypothetical protein
MWFSYDKQENLYQQNIYEGLIALENNESHKLHWKEMLWRLKEDFKELK